MRLVWSTVQALEPMGAVWCALQSGHRGPLLDHCTLEAEQSCPTCFRWVVDSHARHAAASCALRKNLTAFCSFSRAAMPSSRRSRQAAKHPAAMLCLECDAAVAISWRFSCRASRLSCHAIQAAVRDRCCQCLTACPAACFIRRNASTYCSHADHAPTTALARHLAAARCASSLLCWRLPTRSAQLTNALWRNCDKPQVLTLSRSSSSSSVTVQ